MNAERSSHQYTLTRQRAWPIHVSNLEGRRTDFRIVSRDMNCMAPRSLSYNADEPIWEGLHSYTVNKEHA
jgi:hypothetical protein